MKFFTAYNKAQTESQVKTITHPKHRNEHDQSVYLLSYSTQKRQ